jgi:hypothetical protein
VGIAYRFDKSQGLNTIVWDGVITIDDWRAHLEETFADPDWPPGSLSLSDLRSADVSSITTAEQEGIVSMYDGHLDAVRGTKSAAVAGDNFAVSSEFERRKEPSGLRLIIFNDLLNACTWLGIDNAAAQATINELRSQLREQSTSGSAHSA